MSDIMQEFTGSEDPSVGRSPTQPTSPNDLSIFTTMLLFDQEHGVPLATSKQRAIVITASLARVFVRAASVKQYDKCPLTFTSLLVGMMTDSDNWLNNQFVGQGVRFDLIEKHLGYVTTSLPTLTEFSLAPEYLTSESARAVLDEAQLIASLATGGTTIDTRHLSAAYAVLPGWHDQDFADFNIDRREWARALGADMARQFPGEREYWRTYADRVSPVPLAPFSADVYTENDLLGIDRSVDALALLMASTSTVTPLSIGMFGPWGSGKSFFMRHLQRRIVSIRRSEETRINEWIDKRRTGKARSEDMPRYFGEIAQVEFNAWHYNEGNLVASLVEHLFRNLRVLPEEGEDQLDVRRTRMLGKLKGLDQDLISLDGKFAAAEDQVAIAKKDLERAKEEAAAAKNDVDKRAHEISMQIDERKKDYARERQLLDDAFESIKSKANTFDADAAIAVALKPLLANARGTIESVRNQVFDWRDFIRRVFTVKGLVVVALCVVVPLVLRGIARLEVHEALFVSSVMTAFAGFGNAFEVIKHARAQFEEKLLELEAEEKRLSEEAHKQIEQRRSRLSADTQSEFDRLNGELNAQREKLSTHETAVSDAAEKLAQRASEHDDSLAKRVKAEEQVRAAEAELKRLSSALLLDEFINDRLSTNDYRKELGFLALVRRDIEQLSKLIGDANRAWLATDSTDASPVVNRIVLYIDDLDRCKESTVLAVLEAVHLLLAFPLFVCAVAVDPRWVEKCLRNAHPQLFVASNESQMDREDYAPATVGDYLEKIFQIPIWMSPIESHTRAALVNALLGPTAAPEDTVQATGEVAGDAIARTQSPGVFPAKPVGPQINQDEETPDPLRITTEEAQFVQQISNLLSDRPRALKRFVNTYRLLKASLPDVERIDFVSTEPSSGYKICLIQFALFTGFPRLAPLLAKALKHATDASHEGNGTSHVGMTNSTRSLKDWVEHEKPVPQMDLPRLLQFIPEGDVISLDAFRRWLPLTSRYLFERAD